MLTREAVIGRLAERLAAHPLALALWEGGSTAFGTDDEYSDIDLVLIVEDGGVDAAFTVVEAALESLAPIELVWRVGDSGFPGLAQRFYRIAGASPYLLVDFGILERQSGPSFLEPEQHGQARVLFDKASLTTPPPFDEAAFRARMKRDLADARAKFEMLVDLPGKELLRGHAIDGIAFYLALALRPLVMVLGMKHRPMRYDFGLRYLSRDFPPEIARTIEDLVYVRDAADLAGKLPRAQALFRETAASLDLDAVDLAGLSRAARERR